MSSWSSLECSPPCHGGDHGFKSHRGRSTARYANRQSGQAQTLVKFVGSTPTRATGCVGWALASPSGCNPPASSCAGSTPARRTDRPVRLSVRGHQPLTLGRWVQFPYGLLAEWRNGEIEQRVHSGFSIPQFLNFIAGWTGEAPAGSHKPSDAGSNPAPANCVTAWERERVRALYHCVKASDGEE